MQMTQAGVDLTEVKRSLAVKWIFTFVRYKITTDACLFEAVRKHGTFIARQRISLGSGTVITAEIVRPAVPSGNKYVPETR